MKLQEICYGIFMSIIPEQKAFDFEAGKPDIVEVPVEADEDKECGACGNLLASESKGCSQCGNDEIKLNWQSKHGKETLH